MQKCFVSAFVVALCLSGCSDGHVSGSGGFNPPPPADGFLRFKAETVHDVAPGDDVSYCQYVMEPLDHDVDVLSVFGYQSSFGHHAAAFVYSPSPGEKPGSNFPCMGAEFTAAPSDGGTSLGNVSAMGPFLGALGGADGRTAGTALPDGVGVRLTKGSGIMLNIHFLNTGTETIDGDAVVDVKLADPDPNRKLAAMFVNGNMGFTLPAAQATTSSIDCVAQSDLQLIMMTNHMHEYGTSAITQVQRAGGGATEVLHEDPVWTSDMQSNAVYSRWPIETPFQLHTGDTVRTTCSWNNSTPADLSFPREMCVGVAFALVTGDHPTAPICIDGNWLAQGL
jgi:hypothetical protein